MIPYLLAAVGGYLIGDSSSEKFAKGGLIAPNGKKSNLTPELYKLVRTPEFKSWFGDWENDPESASKVVDENGEPLVCYHGSRSEFNEFKINEKSNWDIFWFSPNYESAKMYAEDDEYEGTPNIYKCFLNVRNISKTYPFDLNKYDGFIDYKIEMDWIKFKQIKHIQVVQVVNSNQIKLADGTNTTFDSNNPDIRYKVGGKVWNDKELLKRYKNGESIGFTATAHLKAQGLIPRADGTKRKSMANGGETDEIKAAKDEISVKEFCLENDLIFKENKKITQLNIDYNWDDLYDLYDEDYMNVEFQTNVNIKDLIFSQEYVSKLNLSHINKKPILICVLNGKKYIIDGYHRVLTNFYNGKTSINSYIIHYDDL